MRKPSCHCAEHWVASKRLSGFPTIRKAFKIIQADNGIDDKLINAAVPAKRWLVLNWPTCYLLVENGRK